MKYYINLETKKNISKEKEIYWIFSKIMQNLHIKLVTEKSTNIGISVVNNIIRLHSDDDNSLKIFLDYKSWLSDDVINKCICSTGVKDVSDQKIETYAIFKRFRPSFSNSKMQRIMKRMIERGEEVPKDFKKSYMLNSLNNRTDKLFFMMKSGTNKNNFNLFIDIIETDENSNNTFNSYGLSNNSSVPIFYE